MRTQQLLSILGLLLLTDCRATLTTGASASVNEPPPVATAAPTPAPAAQVESRAVCGQQVQVASSGAEGMCSRRLRLAKLKKSSPTCFVDVIDANEIGELRYPCAGGTAQVSFHKLKFTGTVSNGQVAACVGTTFPFSDGCTWNSAQKLTGSIANGQLHLDYAEEPQAGSSGCATPCDAAGILVIE